MCRQEDKMNVVHQKTFFLAICYSLWGVFVRGLFAKNVSPLCSLEPPLAGMLTARRRAVREQFPAVQHRRALQDTTNHPWPSPAHGTWLLPSSLCPTSAHKLQLQQQIQQVSALSLLCQVDRVPTGP